MNKHKAYRERLKQDPQKLAEQRRKTRERVALHRKKKGPCNATVTRPCNATVPTDVPTDSPDPYSLRAVKESCVLSGEFPDCWSAQDIKDYEEERSAIAEYDGHLSCGPLPQK